MAENQRFLFSNAPSIVLDCLNELYLIYRKDFTFKEALSILTDMFNSDILWAGYGNGEVCNCFWTMCCDNQHISSVDLEINE